jgi:hypothetical protein
LRSAEALFYAGFWHQAVENLRKTGILRALGVKGKRKAHLGAGEFPFWGG